MKCLSYYEAILILENFPENSSLSQIQQSIW